MAKRKISDTLTTLSDAARHLHVPISTLKYRVLTGDVQKVKFGPIWLVDVTQAAEALRNCGYQPRPRKPVEA